MITVGGKTHNVPDVYFMTEVINLGATTIPAFNGLLHIGSAKRGIPFNATGAKGYEVIKAFSDVPSVKKYYGVGDLSTAFQAAKSGGAGTDYFLNVASLTKAKATIKDNAGTPVNAIDIEAKEYGAYGNDISIKFAAADTKTVMTIVPPKSTKYLSANASTASADLALEDVEELFVGQTINVCSNTVTIPQSATILAIDAVNNKITISAVASSAFATADYARIFVEDTDNQEVTSFTTSTMTAIDVIAAINAGNILIASRGTNTGVAPTALSKTFVQAVSGATKGTSPAATTTSGGSYDLAGAALPQLFEEFTNYTKARIRLLNVLTPVQSVLMVYKTVALTLRNLNYSVQIIAGCAKGDIAKTSSDADYPIMRAKALNSSDVILVGMGIDDTAAYLSLAPQLAGVLSAQSVKHNLTWDTISASKVEKFFGESNKESELAPFVNAGVIVIRTGPDGFFVAQGLNTYQKHDKEWNSDDDTSYLIMQRGIVDFVNEGINKQMKLVVGADDITVMLAVEQCLGILRVYEKQGFIYNTGITRSEQIGNAIYVDPRYTPIGSVDFVGGTVTVIIPN